MVTNGEKSVTIDNTIIGEKLDIRGYGKVEAINVFLKKVGRGQTFVERQKRRIGQTRIKPRATRLRKGGGGTTFFCHPRGKLSQN